MLTKALQKNFLSNENILIESLFWLQGHQDEYFGYFVEDYLDEIIDETHVNNLNTILSKPEFLTDELIDIFHEHNKYGFLCRIGFPTYFNYTNPKDSNLDEYHLKVIYSDTLEGLECRIKQYSNEFKKIDNDLLKKDNIIKKNRNFLRLVVNNG